MEEREAFKRISNKYCPYCNDDTVYIVVRNTYKGKCAEGMRCRRCGRNFTIDWSNIKSPRPLYTSVKRNMILRSII